MIQAGDQSLIWSLKGQAASSSAPSYLTIAPWGPTAAGIRLGSDGSIKGTRNTVDDGSGNGSVSGNYNVTGNLSSGGNTSTSGYFSAPGGTSGNVPGYYFSSLAPSGFSPAASFGMYINNNGQIVLNGSSQPAAQINGGQANALVQSVSGGYKIQSGSVSIAANGTATVTFPTSFSTLTAVLITGYDSTNASQMSSFPPYVQQLPGPAGFYIQNSSGDAITVYWLAIGT